jgi:hypothetical protein
MALDAFYDWLYDRLGLRGVVFHFSNRQTFGLLKIQTLQCKIGKQFWFFWLSSQRRFSQYAALGSNFADCRIRVAPQAAENAVRKILRPQNFFKSYVVETSGGNVFPT